MATVTNSLEITVLATEDTTNAVLVNRSATPSLDENIADFVSYAKIPNVLTAIPFPAGITAATKIYIRNIHTAAASILVNMTPQGGAAANICLLGQGDVFCYWQDVVGSAAVAGVSQGYTTLSLQASVANVLCEYFIGG